MKIERHAPGDILKPFVKTFMVVESEGGMSNRLLPDTSIVMALRLKGAVTHADEGVEKELPASVVTGLRRSPRLLNYSKGAATLLVLFKEGGAAPFFKEPLQELFGTSLPLGSLIGARESARLEERLAEADGNAQRVSAAERFLLSRLGGRPPADPLVLDAVRKMKAAGGAVRVKELLGGLPLGRDAFEKRFRRVIGTSPKQFSAIVRLRTLLNRRPPAGGLTDAAYAAGYFDQAHFIRDFKSFTGQTPGDFFKSPPRW